MFRLEQRDAVGFLGSGHLERHDARFKTSQRVEIEANSRETDCVTGRLGGFHPSAVNKMSLNLGARLPYALAARTRATRQRWCCAENAHRRRRVDERNDAMRGSTRRGSKEQGNDGRGERRPSTPPLGKNSY